MTIIFDAIEYGYERVRSKYNNNSDGISGDDVVFTKRRSFEYEKELRLAIYNEDSKPHVSTDAKGLKLKVDLETMISEIIISPEAPYWIVDLVERISKKYDLSFKIKQSNLNKLTF